MSKIIFIGDVHLDSQTPISRIDNYRETTIRKLETLLELSIKNSVKSVVTTGDFFNRFDIPISYINEVITVLQRFKDNSIDFYSVIGNHDLPRNNMRYFDTTPLSLLFKSGLLKRLDDTNIIEEKDFIVHGMNFTEENETYTDSGEKTSILVMHYATENTVPGESISTKELSGRFDIVVSGHDHMYYKPLEKDGVRVYRQGSFTRRTKDTYNLTRDIIVYLYDSKDNSMKEIILPNVKLAENIFKNSVFITNTIELYNTNYSKLFSGLSREKSSANIFDILKDLPPMVNDKSIKVIKEHLKNVGVIDSIKDNKKDTEIDYEEAFSI